MNLNNWKRPNVLERPIIDRQIRNEMVAFQRDLRICLPYSMKIPVPRSKDSNSRPFLSENYLKVKKCIPFLNYWPYNLIK